jgi:hypothetical protein
MKTLLWLDDVRDPFDKDFTPYVTLYNPFLKEPHKIIWVKNYYDFSTYLHYQDFPDAISFDHDLDTEHYDSSIKPEDYKEKTGMDCVKLLVGFCEQEDLKLPICIYHTANPAGKENMQRYIENAKKHLNL